MRAADGPRVRAIVLAAGAGSRFGGRKLEARIAGRPILQHVLDALAGAGLDDPIVVVAPGLPRAGVDLRRGNAVVNPEPGRGLAASLQVGWSAAFAGREPLGAVLVVLGDQPRLRPEVIRALVAAPLDPARPIVAPRYAASSTRNPVRIEASAARLVAVTEGDRGLGPLLDAHPELVRWLDVAGDNPDVDRRSDLVAAIEADWADRVRGNREQVERVREMPEEPDHYAPVTGLFRDDPGRRDDAVLDALLALARAGDTWLDVGAGAGRYAFPLARAVREVIAVEPSDAMAGALRDGMHQHGIANVRVVPGRWPEVAASLAPLPCADVALIANVGHDTESIGPFLEAFEAAARRACVAVMQEQPPASIAAPFFEAVHDEPRTPLPALPDFLDLLVARGATPTVTMLDRPARAWRSRDELLGFLRRQTWVRTGSPADRRLEAELARVALPVGAGLALPSEAASRVGIVHWRPHAVDRP